MSEGDVPAAPGTPMAPALPAADAIRLAEAVIFASAEPVPQRLLAELLAADPTPVLAALQARHAGGGVELVEVAGAWQFRTAADLAPRLRRVLPKPRRLPRAAMETLAVIAWHQPVTRAEIEEIRGASLAQSTMDALLEAGMIRPAGRKETPGRPTLWATTPGFLAQFGLRDLRDLPRLGDLVVEAASPGGQPDEADPGEVADPRTATPPPTAAADRAHGQPETSEPGREGQAVKVAGASAASAEPE